LRPRTTTPTDQHSVDVGEEGRTDADPDVGQDADPDIDAAATGMVLLLRLFLRAMKDGDRDEPRAGHSPSGTKIER
jgi:hypothetical protein